MGVAIASYGEIRFVVLGVILQVAAVVLESTRLILVQVLLQVCALPSWSVRPVSLLRCTWAEHHHQIMASRLKRTSCIGIARQALTPHTHKSPSSR